MATLSQCIKKAGKAISRDDAEHIRNVYTELVNGGMAGKAAEVEAVKQHIDGLASERTQVVSRIKEQGGHVDERARIRDDAGRSGPDDSSGGPTGVEGGDSQLRNESEGSSEVSGNPERGEGGAVQEENSSELVAAFEAYESANPNVDETDATETPENEAALTGLTVKGEEDPLLTPVDEETGAQQTASGVTKNNHGERQAETTRQGIQLRYPTQKITKHPSGKKNRAGAVIFTYKSRPFLFETREEAERYARLLEVKYPNSAFELEAFPVGFALNRANVDPSVRAEPDDATAIYARSIGKLINGGHAAKRNKNWDGIVWLRNPKGARVPFLAASISIMGMEISGDGSDVKRGFLTGVGTLIENGWTTQFDMQSLNNVKFSPRGGPATLASTKSSSFGMEKALEIESHALVALGVNEDNEDLFSLTAATANEILETLDMDESTRTMFLLSQGLEDLVVDPEGVDDGTFGATGTLADETPKKAREFDPVTGEALHPAQDDTGRRKGEGQRVTRATLDRAAEEDGKKRAAKALNRVKSRATEETSERPARPVTMEIAEAEKAKFLESINGNLDTEIVLVDDLRRVSKDPEWRKKYGSSKGYVADLGGGKYAVVVQTGVHATASDIAQTLRHEVLAHVGLAKFFTDRERTQIINMVRAARTTSLKSEWANVRRAYPGSTQQVQAEEVIALISEKTASPFLVRVKRFIEGVLKRLGLSSDVISRADIQAIIQRTTEDFKNGAAERGSGIVTEDVFSKQPLSDAITKANLNRFGRKVNGFFKDIPKLLPFVFTADRELRTMGDIGDNIADWFSQQSSSKKHANVTGVPYFQGVANARARWNRDWDTVVKDLQADDQLTEALDELARADDRGDPASLSPGARKVNDFFQRYREKYLLPNVGLMGKLNIYFPRMFDLAAVESRREELKNILLSELNATQDGADMHQTMEDIIDNILGSGGSPEFSFTAGDKVISPGFSGRFKRELRSQKLNNALREAGFLMPNDVDVVRNYISASTKYGELARVNGGPAGNRLGNLINQLEHQGERDRARLIIEGYMGRIGIHTDQRAVKAMSWVMVFESYLTLLFAAVASIPDFAGPILRSRDMAGAKDALKTVFDVFRDYKDATERARVIGVLNERMTHQALKEAYGQSKADSRSQKALDKLFHWNGQEYLTSWSRVMSAAVAETFLVTNAEKALAGDTRAQRYLKELNVTPEQVQTWDSEGRQPWSPDQDSDAATAAQDAVYQFIDESVIRPNASQRPVWANHPMAMLLWHLKSFFWAYGKVVLGGMGREAASRWSEAEGKGKLAQLGASTVPFAIGGMMLLPLAALARELREEIQYDDEDKEPTNREDPMEYVWGRLGDAGVFGPFELIGGATRFGEDAGGVAANLAGPSFQHLHHLADNGMSWASLKRATPGMNQLPWLNDVMKDTVGAE
jgi:hypothetical protein